ncbi:MAG: patatin-like phospholipase family protein [Gemmatimonadetes bacterium]|nr:patatin-like phospholipase family protein [Gemmatimonadota bacterium]
MNALIASLTLRGNVLARGNFDSLPIPFRAVATDLRSQQPRIIGDGDLAFAVRASIALPLVFQPVRHDTTWLIDGGLSSNTPVAAARSLGAERVWVSRLPVAPPDADAFDDPLTLSAALLNTLFKDDGSEPHDGDVTIRNPTENFENLNFDRAITDSLIRLGYETARAAFAAAGCVRPLNSANAAGGAANGTDRGVLPTRIGTVAVALGNAAADAIDAATLINELGLTPGRTLDVPHTERALTALGLSERTRAVWLNPAGSGPDVTFRPVFDPAPRRAFGIGVAFDQFMSGRLWIGGIDRSVTNMNAEAAVIAQFGSYEQSILGFVRAHTDVRGVHVPVAAGARLAHESVRLFQGGGELPNAETQEGELFFGVRGDPLPGAWKAEAALDVKVWRAPGTDTRGSTGIRASVFRARDDYEMGSNIEALALTDFQRLSMDVSRIVAIYGVQARLRARAGWGNRLPVQYEFTLGGADGFAGLRIGEIRGTQEAFTSLRLARRVAPQLQLTVEGMAGAIGTGSGILQRREGTDIGKVFVGVRVGFEASTPIGPIRIEEGFNNTQNRALLVRVGYWF